MKRRLEFRKEDLRWYAVIPEWKGSKEDLEMVSGADVMLDILAKGDDWVFLTFSDEKFDDAEFIKLLREEEFGGGSYYISKLCNISFEFEIWLCDVTKFVFNSDKMPDKIYIAR